MKIDTARRVATAWVKTHGAATPGYAGGWFGGSTPSMSAGSSVPAGSDIDVVILLDRPGVPPKPGKFLHQEVLLEVTWLPLSILSPLESLLVDYHVGNSLWCAGKDAFIIDDPTGAIGGAHVALKERFAEETWVRRRCVSVRQRIMTGLAHHPSGNAFHDLFLAWLFPTGVLCHLPLVAALQNPTIRRRYVAARKVLAEYGLHDLSVELLKTLGSAAMTKAQVKTHLDRLAITFDAAAATPLTHLSFASDIAPAARPVAIDGTQAMIDAGDHREAIFWIAATFARCHAVLAINDADLGNRLYPHFQTLADDMGVSTVGLLRRRADQTLAALPALWEASQRIVEQNPDIAHNR